MQAIVRSMTGERHMVTCDGGKIPLQPTGTHGEFVAGVRYRAWQPANCLHPTIPVHTPLVYDLLDTWNDRSVVGCTCDSAHPGGMSHESFPVNSYEAESRRLARFFQHGHTGFRMQAREAPICSDFPFTLDLLMIP